MTTEAKSTSIFLQRHVYEIDCFRKALLSLRKPRLGVRFGKKRRYPCVVLVTGDAGVGKTEAAKELVSQAEECGIKGIWIDLYEVQSRYPEYFEQERNDPENLLHVIYTAYRDAGYGAYFDEYERCSQLITDAERKVAQALESTTASSQQPESFEKLRQFAAQTIRHFVGSATLGPAYELIPQDVKEAADDALSETIKAAAVGLARARLNKQEFDVYMNGTDRLVNSLANGVRAATRSRPSLVVLDHGELVCNVDPWLRYLVRQSGVTAAWLIVSTAGGRLPLTETYRNDIHLSGGLVDFQMSPLEIEAVGDIINSHISKRRDATPGEIRAVYQLTGGNPLALRMAMELWYPGHPEGTAVLNPPAQHARIANPVFERYLHNISSSPDDQWILSILAFCYGPDMELLKALLGDDAEGSIRKLAHRYPYLFETEHKLRSSVAYWVRERLLTDFATSDFQKIARQAVDWLYESLKTVENQVGDLAESVQREPWRERALALVYHCFWLNDATAYEVVLQVLRGLLFLPPCEMRSFVTQIWGSVGPLAHSQDKLSGLVRTFQHGLLRVVEIPDGTTKLQIHHEIVQDEKGRVIAEIGPSQAQKAVQILEDKVRPNDQRYVAVHAVKASLLSRLNDPKGACAALELAKQMATAPGDSETSKFLGESYRQLGKTLLDFRGPSDLALRCLQQAEELLDRNAVLTTHIALAHLRQCDYERAIENADEAIAMDPSLWNAYDIKGSALTGLRRHDEAAQAYRECLDRDQTPFVRAALSTNLGIVLMNQGRLDEADKHFEDALHAEPNYPAALICRSLVWHERDPDRALFEMKRAVQFVRSVDEWFIARTEYLLNSRDDETAVEILETILANCQETGASPYVMASLQYLIGERRSRQKRWALAVKHFKEAIEAMPQFLPAYYSLGETYRVLHRYRESRQYYFRAFELDLATGSRLALRAISSTAKQMSSKEFDRRSKGGGGSKRTKSTGEGLLQQSAAGLLAGKADKAIQDLRRALNMGYDDSAVHFMLCGAEMTRGNLLAAARHAEDTIIRTPEGRRGIAYFTLGGIHDEMGATDEALEAYRNSLTEYESDTCIRPSIRTFVLFSMALCLYRAGDLEQALRTFQDAFFADPTSWPGRLSRMILLIKENKWVEARLELRRLDKDSDWTRELDFAISQKWRNPELGKTYHDFVNAFVVAPVSVGALLCGDKDLITQIIGKYGSISEELLNFDHPIFEISTVDWDTVLPQLTAATKQKDPGESTIDL